MKIYALIVTYNRKPFLEKALDSLMRQTVKLSGIILINNNSTDGTNEFLKERFGIDCLNIDKSQSIFYKRLNFIYYQSSKNLGGSGGFTKGFEISKNISFDYLWVMDDDVSPRSNCLETLLQYKDAKYDVLVPRRIGVNFHDPIITKYRFTNPFANTFINRSVEVKNIDKKTYEVKTFTFEGPLFTKNIINKVGLPDQSYFLQGDDYDYAFRCLQFTRILYVVDAVIDRQIPIIKSKKTPYWRLYYSLRNASILDYRYSSFKLFAIIRVSMNRLKWILISRLKHHDNIESIVVKRAFRDARHNNMGHIVTPQDYDIKN